jgi:Pyruvate/2-oxoacid:ferredoxin oxidoreductase delta subunit
MEKVTAIFTNPGFWTIAAPAFLAIFAWYLNERAKRKWEEYGRKEERYKELLRTLKGFYVTTHDPKLKEEFIHQVNLCWLYTPDEVIQKAYAFLDNVCVGTNSKDKDKEGAVGALVVAIRKDLLSRKMVKKTKLQASGYKHLRST